MPNMAEILDLVEPSNESVSVETATVDANRELCWALRGAPGITHAESLACDLRKACKQLACVEEFPHDAVLPEDVLERASEFDHVGTELRLAAQDLRDSLKALKSAHARVAGLLKGPEKDQIEESLLRSIKSADRQLLEFESKTNCSRVSNRPFEIRREVLSYLLKGCTEAEESITKYISQFGERAVSADLLETLKSCQLHLAKLGNEFRTLRQRCSQRMAANLVHCQTRLNAIIEAFNLVEITAGTRAGLRTHHCHDYPRRLRRYQEESSTAGLPSLESAVRQMAAAARRR
jgi:vacuolar-type H+-ATPase subunit I/STV1